MPMDDSAGGRRDELNLPAGVALRSLATHRDGRGSVTELFRSEWATGVEPVQWNFVASGTGVLRGVHAHVRHSDYLALLRGRMLVGLRDLRPASPTAGLAALVELREDRLDTLAVPPGVAHGFYFPEPSLHVYAVDSYWDAADELGCHWADPALGIPWPFGSAQISERDAALPPLSKLDALLATVKL